jgi:hypothetical protein
MDWPARRRISSTWYWDARASGTQGRQREIPDEGQVVGQDHGRDAKVKVCTRLPRLAGEVGRDGAPAVQRPENHEGDDVVHEIGDLHQLRQPRGGVDFEPQAEIDPEQCPVPLEQEPVLVPRV